MAVCIFGEVAIPLFTNTNRKIELNGNQAQPLPARESPRPPPAKVDLSISSTKLVDNSVC
jgi:hypothetical protein